MRKLNVSGGEPFLNATNIGEVFKFCKTELGLESTSVLTNSSKVTERRLDEYGHYLDIIATSCDTADLETNLAHGRTEKGKPTHISQVWGVMRWCKGREVRVKINSMTTKYNYLEDMNQSISQLAPFCWKIFQVLLLEGGNNGADNVALRDTRNLLITREQFRSLLYRHKGQQCLVPEVNDAMHDS
ncbi:hypothetical protein RhiJN_06661 [Ceratobasidium sp. AG-Ba]|nr:hypothetical protein RhiJN_06661 [Ceratobasidium sp. AG-Ba]